MTTTTESTTLPPGWLKEFDPNAQRHFYVDTNSTPPRSIWVHPYEDEQYLREHPEHASTHGKHAEGSAPPPYESPRRHSWNGTSQAAGPSSSKTQKRGMFGKLKDKMIGTKEEREAQKRLYEQMQAERMQQRRAQAMMYAQRGPMYGPPMRPGWSTGPAYGGGYQRRGGGGFGGAALPLAGGLAGGLILGDLLSDGFHDHDYNDYGGGGDFGGGDFGGGDFGGGGDF